MGLAHPDLVFRIQDSIITEPKTLMRKKTLKKTQSYLSISLLAYRRLYAVRTSEAE